MTWTALSYAFGSKLTSLKMSQNQDNFTAAVEGHAGSPKILAAALNQVGGSEAVSTPTIRNLAVTTSKLNAGTVNQSKLFTTTASGSTSTAIVTFEAAYALVGGTYSWWTASAITTSTTRVGLGNGDTAAGTIGFGGTVSGTAIYIDERYVQASPPYRYGPLFITLMLSKSGGIIGSQIAEDPIWAYHGPTNISIEYYKGDRGYRKCCFVDGVPLCKALSDKNTMSRFIENDLETQEIEVEVTLDYKDSDAKLIYHPFGIVPEGATVLLIRPETGFIDKLHTILKEDHAGTVRDLFLNNYIDIDNSSDIALPGLPNHFKSYNAKWRKSL